MGEAALMYANVAPGLVREALIGGSGGQWHAVPQGVQPLLAKALKAAHEASRPYVHLRKQRGARQQDLFLGRDVHPGALSLARRSAKALEQAMPGVTSPVGFEVGD